MLTLETGSLFTTAQIQVDDANKFDDEEARSMAVTKAPEDEEPDNNAAAEIWYSSI